MPEDNSYVATESMLDVLNEQVQQKAKQIDSNKVKGASKVWTYKIVDDSKVLRKYLMLDTAKIWSAIRGGERTIEGLDIYQEHRVSIR